MGSDPVLRADGQKAAGVIAVLSLLLSAGLMIFVIFVLLEVGPIKFALKNRTPAELKKRRLSYLWLLLTLVPSFLFNLVKSIGSLGEFTNADKASCNSLSVFGIFCYAIAKTSIFSFLCKRAMYVHQYDPKTLKAIKGWTWAIWIVMSTYIVWTPLASEGYIEANSRCIYHLIALPVLFSYPLFDLIFSIAVMYYYLKPLVVTPEAYRSPVMIQVLKENKIAGIISVGITQFVMIFSIICAVGVVVSGEGTGLIVAGLTSPEVAIMGLMQVLLMRKTWKFGEKDSDDDVDLFGESQQSPDDAGKLYDGQVAIPNGAAGSPASVEEPQTQTHT